MLLTPNILTLSALTREFKLFFKFLFSYLLNTNCNYIFAVLHL